LRRLLTLDLKMPRMNGFDVLSWLRVQRHFKNLPRGHDFLFPARAVSQLPEPPPGRKL
jgi:CheY-like chemotaxis protein